MLIVELAAFKYRKTNNLLYTDLQSRVKITQVLKKRKDYI